MPTNRSVEQLIEMRAASTPKEAAVEVAGDVLTYDQLNRRANQLAEYLRRSGATPGTAVAVLMDLSTDFFVATLAVLKIGAVQVAANPRGPSNNIGVASVGFVLTDNSDSVNLVDCIVIDVASERGLIAWMPDSNTSVPLNREMPQQRPEVVANQAGGDSSAIRNPIYQAKTVRSAQVGRSISLPGCD